MSLATTTSEGGVGEAEEDWGGEVQGPRAMFCAAASSVQKGRAAGEPRARSHFPRRGWSQALL
jgi:hypothetical protein